MTDSNNTKEDVDSVTGNELQPQNDRNLRNIELRTNSISNRSNNIEKGIKDEHDVDDMQEVNIAHDDSQYVAYGKRWIILMLFVVYSATNNFQWTQLVIISNVLEKYYQVTTLTVTWTSMVYMVTYIPLIFPASWILQKKGLRLCVILGSLGTCVGSWIKVLGTGQEDWCFPIVFTGQTIVAISQMFVLGMPAEVAAVWFPSQQVSTACAIGVFGNQLGAAIGFAIPPIIVSDQKDKSDYHLIGKDLFKMFLGVAVETSILLILIICLFTDHPPSPPSRAQQVGGVKADNNYVSSIKKLVKNRGFVLLLISYGLNVGVYYAISSLLNTVVLSHFEHAQTDAGLIGLVIIISGMAGSMICGIILDKTHQYKITTIVIYILSLIGMLVYTFIMRLGHIELVYLCAGFLGFFMTGYLNVGFDFGVEITYPESEGTSSGLLNASAQAFGIICTIISERIITETDEDRIANILQAALLFLGAILTALIKPDYRRQRASTLLETLNN